MAYRRTPRLTLHGMVVVSELVDADLTAIGAAAAIGYRQNFAAQVGVQIRFGGGAAGVSVATDGSSPKPTGSTSMTELYGDVAAFLGPLGRFYLGPLLWYSHFTFADHAFQPAGSPSAFVLPDAWKGGGGLDMGLLLLQREQLDVNWRIKTTFNSQMPFRLEMGIGYHFM